MMVDSLAGVPLPSVVDVKIEKKEGVDGLRPIEESGDTSDTGLNIAKDNAAKHRAVKEEPLETPMVAGYNARGEPVSGETPKDEATGENPSINLDV